MSLNFLPGADDRVTVPSISRFFPYPNPLYCVHNASCLVPRVSCIVYRASCILDCASCIVRRASFTTQRYPSYVYMFTDLKQLAKAEVFVGTFSSNVGRLVALLREAAGKSRKSSISIDRDWAPGRV